MILDRAAHVPGSNAGHRMHDATPVSATKSAARIGDANRTLVEAIARGYRWHRQLESGEYANVEDLAQAVARTATTWGGCCG
jgi:hypothetical protein